MLIVLAPSCIFLSIPLFFKYMIKCNNNTVQKPTLSSLYIQILTNVMYSMEVVLTIVLELMEVIIAHVQLVMN